MINIFSKFTDRSRRVYALAQEEAQNLHHPTVSPEHFLLAMAAEGENEKGEIACHALTKVGFNLKKARNYCYISRDVTMIDSPLSMRAIPLASSSKRLLEQSLREATSLGDNFVGTEHLLLGLIAEESAETSLAGKVLLDQEISLEAVSRAVTDQLVDVQHDSTSKLMDEIATLKSEVASLRIDLLRARKRAIESEIRGLNIALQTIEVIMAKES